jgi:dUTP pyrophosphatase
MTTLKIKKLDSAKDLPTFEYKTEHSAGLDLISTEDVYIKGVVSDISDPAMLGSSVKIVSIDQKLVSTGIIMEIPEGYYGMVAARSGLAVKNKIDVGISPGIIDRDFRGELKVLIRNYGEQDFEIKRGDRIAQLVLIPYLKATIDVVEELSDTARGSGGFGSTGV